MAVGFLCHCVASTSYAAILLIIWFKMNWSGLEFGNYCSTEKRMSEEMVRSTLQSIEAEGGWMFWMLSSHWETRKRISASGRPITLVLVHLFITVMSHLQEVACQPQRTPSIEWLSHVPSSGPMGPYFRKILNGSQWRETAYFLSRLNWALKLKYDVCQFKW